MLCFLNIHEMTKRFGPPQNYAVKVKGAIYTGIYRGATNMIPDLKWPFIWKSDIAIRRPYNKKLYVICIWCVIKNYFLPDIDSTDAWNTDK